MVGTGTTFISSLAVGDYIKVANSTANQVFLISSVSNNTLATLSTNAVSMNTLTANLMLFFPAYRPINFTSRDTRTISINSVQNTLTANLATNLVTGGIPILSTYTVRKTNASQVTRTVYRNAYVKIQASNNAATTYGPWALGVPDAIRLNNVYLGSTSGVSTSDTDVTKHFFIDSGQTPDYFGSSYLYKQNDSSLVLTGSDFLLVKFDVLTHSATGGFNTVSSFTLGDANTLALSTSTINTMEIPEYFGSDQQIDLRNAIDFRPIVANTAAITNTASSATLNPANTVSLGSSTKFFPVPDSSFTYDVERYLGRGVNIILNKNGDFQTLQGDPGVAAVPATPPDSISLAVLKIPEYPTLGAVLSNTMSTFVTKRIGNSSGTRTGRTQKHLVGSVMSSSLRNSQPSQYSMKDISSLENRIQALEYQASFNKLENEVQQLNLSSSLDATISRFKNGFFVDSFVDSIKVDESNKEFAAYIDFERGELHPEEVHLNLQMEYCRNDATTSNALIENKTLMLPFDEFTIISQPKATSVVSSEGSMSQFTGEMVATPTAFEMEARFEQSTVVGLNAIPPVPVHVQPSGGGGSCKIVCTKLHELGYLDDNIFAADQRFGERLRATDPDAYYGYVKWAQIVVDWMGGKGPQCMFWIRDEQKRNDAQRALAISWARRIATPWAYHMAYIMGETKEDNRAGRAIMKVGIFVSKIIGKLFKKPVEKPSTNTFIGFSMWGVFVVFYMLAGLEDKKV